MLRACVADEGPNRFCVGGVGSLSFDSPSYIVFGFLMCIRCALNVEIFFCSYLSLLGGALVAARWGSAPPGPPLAMGLAERGGDQ